MIYKVEIDYKSFTFTDRNEALDFADLANEHADNSVNVSVKLIKEVADNE